MEFVNGFRMTSHIWKITHVPNHQPNDNKPVDLYRGGLCSGCSHVQTWPFWHNFRQLLDQWEMFRCRRQNHCYPPEIKHGKLTNHHKWRFWWEIYERINCKWSIFHQATFDYRRVILQYQNTPRFGSTITCDRRVLKMGNPSWPKVSGSKMTIWMIIWALKYHNRMLW